MSEDRYDDIINEAFSELAHGAPPVRTVGIDVLQARVRHRHQARMGAMVAIAALVIATPVAAASLGDDRSMPAPATSATAAPTESTESASPAPASSPTEASAQPPPLTSSPGGSRPLTGDDIARASIDVPAWQWGRNACPPSGPQRVKRAGAGSPAESVGDVVVVQALPVNLDSDPADEVAALLGCRIGEVHTSQIVALERDSAGKIVTLGQIAVSTDAMNGIWKIATNPGGTVFADVSDTISCCDTPKSKEIHQQRAYRWNGTTFVQTGGPKHFNQPADRTDLEVTASPVTFGPVQAGDRTGTMTVTVRNVGPRSSGRFTVTAELGDNGKVRLVSPQSTRGCATDALCHAALRAGGSVTFTVTVTETVGSSPAGGGILRVLAYSDEAPLFVQAGDLNGANDSTYLTILKR